MVLEGRLRLFLSVATVANVAIFENFCATTFFPIFQCKMLNFWDFSKFLRKKCKIEKIVEKFVNKNALKIDFLGVWGWWFLKNCVVGKCSGFDEFLATLDQKLLATLPRRQHKKLNWTKRKINEISKNSKIYGNEVGFCLNFAP